MASNAEAAALLNAIADLLDVRGEKFKPEAYRRAARSIDGLGEDLASVAGRGALDSIPGVGAAIAEKLREYLREGRIAYLDRLATEVPPGILALLKVQGLGPKTVRRFWIELGLSGPAELAAAIDAGRLAGVRGFGATKIHQIRTALDARPAAPRIALLEATTIAATLMEGIRSAAPVERIEVAGSLRRARETVGDLDLLVISADAEAVFDAVSHLPQVASVVLRGGTKETVLLTTGLQVDVRVLAPSSFGAALQYFTGSKDHNVRLRSLARDRGLKINEYAVYRGEEVVAGVQEADVYGALGLAWIPPELRENRGEIDQAANGTLPTLVDVKDLRGDLHVHLPLSSGPEQLDALRRSAKSAGHTYVGVVVQATDGAALSRLSEYARGAREGPKVLVGIEAEWTARSDPIPEGVEYRLLRADPAKAPSAGTASVEALAVTHLALAPPGSLEGDPALATPWIRWAAEAGLALEVTPAGSRDGLDSALARTFSAAGGQLLLSGRTEGIVDPVRLGVAVALARRAGIGPDRIRNALPVVQAGATAPPTTPDLPRRKRGPRGSTTGGPPRS
jgi:DNA polymerase (family 10)